MKEYRPAKKRIPVSVGESVRILRELQELSQSQLAELTGMPQATISAIENEEVPYFFLGWVAHHASERSYSFKVLRAVRYANNCRFWLKINADTSVGDWRRDHLSEEALGSI